MIFEADLQVVIQGISASMANQTMCGHVVDDILHEVVQMRFFEFCYVNHIYNKVTDGLAKKS